MITDLSKTETTVVPLWVIIVRFVVTVVAILTLIMGLPVVSAHAGDYGLERTQWSDR